MGITLICLIYVSTLTLVDSFGSWFPQAYLYQEANKDVNTMQYALDNQPKSYKNYKLVRIIPYDEESFKYLKQLYSTHWHQFDLDFWKSPTKVGNIVDLTVSPKHASIFFMELEIRNIDYFVVIQDLESVIDNETFAFRRKFLAKDSNFEQTTEEEANEFHYNLYNPLTNIEAELFRFRKENPKIVKLMEIGRTYENRSIYTLKFEFMDEEDEDEIMDEVDSEVQQNLNANPKTTTPAIWIDAEAGSSPETCHETYHGISPFSEPETRAVRDFLEENPVKAFITMHSYSQLWLIPFGHRKNTYSRDYKKTMKPLSMKAAKALRQLYGTKYSVGTGADLLYEASGASHDYAKGVLNIPYSFLVELRPQNTIFSTESEIYPTGNETWAAIKVVADELYTKYCKNDSIIITTSPPTTTDFPELTTTFKPYTFKTLKKMPTRIIPLKPMPEPYTLAPIQPSIVPKTETPEDVDEVGEVLVFVIDRSKNTKKKTSLPVKPIVSPQRLVSCINQGPYCKWWRIHGLCANVKVREMCRLSCLAECQI